MIALVAQLRKSAAFQIDDFQVVLLFSLAGLALLFANPDTLVALANF